MPFAVNVMLNLSNIRNRKTAQKIVGNRKTARNFGQKLKTKIKALTDKASVGFRISLSVI